MHTHAYICIYIYIYRCMVLRISSHNFEADKADDDFIRLDDSMSSSPNVRVLGFDAMRPGLLWSEIGERERSSIWALNLQHYSERKDPNEHDLWLLDPSIAFDTVPVQGIFMSFSIQWIQWIQCSVSHAHAMAELTIDDFDCAKHVMFFKKCAKSLPEQYKTMDTNRCSKNGWMLDGCCN